MNRFALLITVTLGSVGAPAFAQKPSVTGDSATVSSPGKAATANVVRVTASVEAVDAASRTVTLKGPRGTVQTLTVGPEVKNFDRIKVGDLVVVRYVEALTLELKKGGAGIRERSEVADAVTAKPGAQPAAAAARRIKVIADVVAVDPKKSTITLRGPKRTVELKVRNPEHFKVVKVGDQVEATYTEAVAISVEPAAPKVPAEKTK